MSQDELPTDVAMAPAQAAERNAIEASTWLVPLLIACVLFALAFWPTRELAPPARPPLRGPAAFDGLLE